MYYDDESRRFNFLSGFLLGSVLGVGLALLVKPRAKRSRGRRLRGAVRSVGRAPAAGVERAVRRARR